ncbi:MAG: arsenate reductase family protein [Flavobacteriaceae bacterium]
MRKIFYLSSCSTCKRIINELQNVNQFDLQDIKTQPLNEEDLEMLFKRSGSYEALFSKRAVLYKTYDLKNKNLSELDFKSYLLEHYTFLKRPVIIFNDTIFIGNSKKVIEEAKKAINEQ